MGVSPMSLTGILPVVLLLPFRLLVREETKETETTGGTPVGLMGKMPMLRSGATGYHNTEGDIYE